jgi:hypothetical protein
MRPALDSRLSPCMKSQGLTQSLGLKRSGAETDRKTLMRSPQYRVEIRGIQSVLGSPALVQEGVCGSIAVISRDILPVRRLSRAVAPDSNLLALRRGQGLDVSCFCHIIRKFCPAPAEQEECDVDVVD